MSLTSLPRSIMLYVCENNGVCSLNYANYFDKVEDYQVLVVYFSVNLINITLSQR